MDQHPIDNLFNQKLNQREFQFNEEHWMGAMAMIEEQEKKKKRRFLLWLLLGTFALISMGIMTVGYYSWNNTTKTAKKDTTEIVASSESNNNSSISSTPEEKSIQDNSLNTVNNQSITDLHYEANTSSETVNSSSQPTQKPSVSKNNTTSSSAAYSSSNTPTQAIAQTIVEPTLNTNENSITVNDIIHPITDSLIKNSGEPSMEASPKPTFETVQPLQPTNSLSIAWQLIPKTSSVVTLEELLDKVMKPESPKFPEDDNNGGDMQGWSLGVSGSVLRYSSPLAARNFGYAGGLTSKFRLTKQSPLFLGLNANYNVRQHYFSNLALSRQISYSFGKEEAIFSLRPTAIHTFELPIWLELGFGKQQNFDFTANNRFRRHALMVGVVPAYLYGVQGEVLDPEGINTQQGWIETDAYKNVQLHSLIGYNFYLLERVSIGLRARYTIGTIVNPDFTYPAGVEVESPKKLHFELNASYYFVRK